jgi:hypothetical protein
MKKILVNVYVGLVLAWTLITGLIWGARTGEIVFVISFGAYIVFLLVGLVLDFKTVLSQVWIKYGRKHTDNAHGVAYSFFWLYHLPCCLERHKLRWRNFYWPNDIIKPHGRTN